MSTKSDPGYPYGEFDAREWAKEFQRVWGDRLNEVDEELMVGWFANAIMTGYDKAMNDTTFVVGDELRLTVEPDGSISQIAGGPLEEPLSTGPTR
jgi:hypothetical protein